MTKNKDLLKINEVVDNVNKLKNWFLTPKGVLERQLQCKDFSECVLNINQLENVANKLGHHPDVLIHSYNKMSIFVYTHSVSGITDLDFKFIEEIDKILKESVIEVVKKSN